MIRRQVQIFFTALMFYTRIPCPSWVDHKAEYLNKATIYFPVIGWLVGGLAFVTFWLAGYLFSNAIAVLLSMVASVLLTGAFHEDGFADTCDGFGGGWTKERILIIMKDSRLGTYGAVGLIFTLALKYLTLLDISGNVDLANVFFVFITAHALSRWAAASSIFTHRYVREDDHSKAKPVAQRMSVKDLAITTFYGVTPLLLWVAYQQTLWFLLLIIPVYASKMTLLRFFEKWIGGYTGDCLGAIQQIAEVVIYLSVLVAWRMSWVVSQ